MHPRALELQLHPRLTPVGRAGPHRNAIKRHVRAEAYGICVEAALGLHDEATIEELQAWCGALPPACAPPLLPAGRERLRAEQAQRRRDAEAAVAFEQVAISRLRAVGARPLLRRALPDVVVARALGGTKLGEFSADAL